MAEKKQELEKRLQDVTGQLGGGTNATNTNANTTTNKKTPKKGNLIISFIFFLNTAFDQLVLLTP